MNLGTASLPFASELPGWYGKLPGMGDFARRRLPDHFLQAWDTWLQNGMHAMRSRHADWVDRYLQGPVWFFALGTEVIGPLPWVGILMPSVDSAGRYFPLAVLKALDEPRTELRGPNAAWLNRYWQLSAQVAVAALDQDLDAARFESALAQNFDGFGTGQGGSDLASVVHLPAVGQSSWQQSLHEASSADFACRGLPRGQAFDVLFGCGDVSTLGSIPSAEVTP